MVTRTFKSTIITYKAANVSAETVETLTCKAPRVFTDEDAAYKYVRKHNTDSNIRPLMVTGLSHDEQLYGCTEEQFLTVAVPITSRRSLNNAALDGGNDSTEYADTDSVQTDTN